MKGRRGFTLIELLVVIAIIAILAAILFPVFARVRRTAMNSDCQSNMKQIGSAFKMYLGDWKDAYPVQFITGTAASPPAVLVRLTPTSPPMFNPDGTPKRFYYGTNWIEALFPYMETISKDSSGAWKCNAASELVDDTGGLTAGGTAKVNYAMNMNLVGQPEGIIKTASNMLLVRETDRKVNSILRPLTVSTATVPGGSPFLSGSSAANGGYTGTNSAKIDVQPKQHGNGSNILFSDGHVKGFSADTLPQVPIYDTDDAQWYNATLAGPPVLRKAIAVSP